MTPAEHSVFMDTTAEERGLDYLWFRHFWAICLLTALSGVAYGLYVGA
jgi:hypothetical protein